MVCHKLRAQIVILNYMETNRYQPYLQSEFSTAFDRLASLREEMDRLFESPVGPSATPGFPSKLVAAPRRL